MPAKFQVPLFYNFDDRYWTASVSATAEQVEEIDPIPHYSTVDFAVTFCAGGVATTLTAPNWTGGIKVKDDFSGTYLVQLSNPTLVGTVYTFTMLIDSTELRTALLSPQNQYAFEIHEATSGISTLVPIFFSISRSYTLTGASPTSATGTLVVAATKTVSFPLSLTFPSANGTNGFQLTTDGAGALTWATAGISGITIGTTTANGTAGRVLYTDGALVQQYAISGTGSVAMTNTPTFVAPVLGAATATSINGITITAGGSGTLTMLGSIDTSASGFINTNTSGGSISTQNSGGNINTSNSGGSINTSQAGGSIDTRNTGSIELGYAGTRTTFRGNAASSDKTIDLPNLSGTVAVADTSATATQALFATTTAGAPAYRAIATADIATALTTPGAIGGTTASTGAFTTLSASGLLTANGGITLGDAQNIAFNTTTGTKIGAATTQKLAFWNTAPIAQPTTAIVGAAPVHGAGTNIKTDDTFNGYTIQQVVQALKNTGLLA